MLRRAVLGLVTLGLLLAATLVEAHHSVAGEFVHAYDVLLADGRRFVIGLKLN